MYAFQLLLPPETILIQLSPLPLVKVLSDLHVVNSRGQFSVLIVLDLGAAFDPADLPLLLSALGSSDITFS